MIQPNWDMRRGLHIVNLLKRFTVKIETLLQTRGKSWADIQGLVCFQGPGSFTGLRIGLTVANALSYSYNLPVVAMQILSGLKQVFHVS